MTRASILASAAMALTLTLSAGCGKASDEQQRADAAQAEADKKAVEANKETTTETTAAQVEADKKIAGAEADFGKRREDYRHSIQSNLVDLDKKIELLEAKANAATGKVKTDRDLSLAWIRTRRAAFGASFAAVETAPAHGWDSTKARVDNDWADLEPTVAKAD